jgi:hypothetical protein
MEKEKKTFTNQGHLAGFLAAHFLLGKVTILLGS